MARTKPKKTLRGKSTRKSQKQGKKVVGRTRTAATAKSKNITTRI